MPTNRRKRGVKRRGESGGSMALQEYLLTGHWWPFLAEEGERCPSLEETRGLFAQYRGVLRERAPDCWAVSYFEGNYQELLDNWQGWIKNAQDEQAVKDGCWFDLHAADRVVKFFERFLKLSHGDVAGKNIKLLDWQKFQFLMPLYGWRRSDGTRRFRQAYVEIPKKNGKSTTCSGLILYHLIGDNETAAEVYSAANDREQASIIFREAERMIRQSDMLMPLLHVIPTQKEVRFGANGSLYKALSADVPTKEGMNISGVVIDELHSHKKPDLFRTLRYGGAARRQPMLIVITTAGEERNGVCWERHEYAEKVRDNVLSDTSFLPLIFGIDQQQLDEDPECWRDESVWYQVNPSLGGALSIENMRDDFKEACQMVSEEMTFKRYRLNVWGEKDMRWLRMDAWQECPRVDPKLLLGKPCYLGVDLASRVDLASVVAVFDLDDLHVWLPFFFAPEENAKRREEKDRVPYLRWAQEGHLILTPGHVTDYGMIRDLIVDHLAVQYDVRQVGCDPWNATQLEVELDAAGLEVVEVRQGFASLTDPSKEVEARVISGRLAHNDHPVLKWQASNVVARLDPAGNIKPDKEKSSERIDGIVAGIIATHCLLRGGGEEASVYEERGVLVL